MPAATQYIIIDPHRCAACWQCVEECPQKVIGKLDFLFHKHSHIDNAEACIGCKNCVKNCPNQAILELGAVPHPVAYRMPPGRRHRDWQRNVVDLIQ